MILVLGATGTVGSAAVAALKQKNASIRAGSRDPQKAMAQLGVTAVAWDWDQPAGFAGALAGVDALFLVTPPGTEKELDYGLAALAAAKAAGVKRIVKLSAIGVENSPDSPHRKMELAIEASGLSWTFLRPSFFMQNLNEGMIHGIKAAGAISVPTGEGKTGMIDARDIGAVAAEALVSDILKSHALTLTGGEALSYAEMAATLSQVLGKPIRHDDCAPEAYLKQLVAAGVPQAYAEFLVMLYGFVKQGFVATVNDEVAKVLGRPPIKFEQYAQDYKQQFLG